MKWVVRILLAVVGLVVLAASSLWLAGFREGAGRNSATVEIHRPAAQVWRYLRDDELVKKWAIGLTEIEHVNPEVKEVGARLRMVGGQGNQRMEMEMEITAWEPMRRIAFKLASVGHASEGFRETGEYLLEESGGRTRISLTTHSTYYPFWIQLMEPVITPAAQKSLEQSLANLKRLVEAEPAAGN